MHSSNSQLSVRHAGAADANRIREIQTLTPDCARWEQASLVALWEGEVAGYIAFRAVADDEFEVLDLAVDPRFRRRGAGRALIAASLAAHPGSRCFLEVRESNLGARTLYESVGFRVVSYRPGYYQSPVETGIVMGFSP